MRDKLEKLGKFIIEQTKQGQKKHRKSGKLERSTKYEVVETLNGGDLIVSQLEYGQYLDKNKDALSDNIDKNIDSAISEIIEEELKYLYNGDE